MSPQRVSIDADDDECCIVRSRVVHGAFEEIYANLVGRRFGGEGFGNMAFPDAVDEAVGADEETVARLVIHGREMGADL